ncbi:ISKra4 family transposase, partial [bacterium]|nr:ISKra4 family transposase [bacterium]
FGLRGSLELERHLFREVGVRNGPTVVPLELNAGLVDGLWTPRAAAAAGRLLQEMPSRDAAQICKALQVMPYSRSSLERVTGKLGTRWEEVREDAEAELIDRFEVPEEAAAVTVSVDRVSLPMEEFLLDDAGQPVLDSTGRERLRAAYRMAYCGVWTLHDAEGEPLHSVRYGRLPREGHGPIEEMLWTDLFALKTKKPELKVVGLADGAPEMQLLLDRTAGLFDLSSTIGLDFWHVVEKLAAAIKATDRASTDWMPKFKTFLRTDDRGAERVLMTLESWRVAYSDEVDPPEALQAAITYVKGNVDRMRYKRLLDQGLPIGSGHVEATCKTLVSTRMKRCGARWKPPGGQAILSLRALAKSSRWDDAMGLLLPTWTVTVREVA